MGFTTFVHILNDAFSEIEKNPEQFVETIRYGMNRGGNFGIGNHVNHVDVLRAEHADTFQLVASHGNLPVKLTKYEPTTRELAERRPDLVRQYVKRARTELDMLDEWLDKIEGA